MIAALLYYIAALSLIIKLYQGSESLYPNSRYNDTAAVKWPKYCYIGVKGVKDTETKRTI